MRKGKSGLQSPAELLIFIKKIKHIYNRQFRLRMVPLDAEYFKLFKYMCFVPKRSFVASSGRRKVGSRLKIEAKIQKVLPLAAHPRLFTE